MEISVRSNYAALGLALTRLQREQLPYAAARALNDTALAVRDGIRAEVPRIFDRPTPFTVRAVVAPRELAATKTRLSATVTLQPIQAKYLLLEETGGVRVPAENTRNPAVAALVEPGRDLPLDRYGNIPSGLLARLSRQVAARTGVRAKKGQVKRDTGIVYIRGGDPRAHGRPGGFFRRMPGGKLQRLTGFVARATYKPRFGFRSRVERLARAAFAARLARRLSEALSTAR